MTLAWAKQWLNLWGYYVPQPKPEKDSIPITITPEMIRAGIKALFQFDDKLENEEEAVKRIYFAMVRSTSPVGCSPD